MHSVCLGLSKLTKSVSYDIRPQIGFIELAGMGCIVNRKIVFTAGAVMIFAATAMAQDIAFEDARGTKIEFDAPPRRVVTIVRSAPIIYRAVDNTAEHIAGMNADSRQRYFEKGIYAELLPELASISANAAREGFAPNVEAILEMQPDAVIQWIYDPEIIEPLERVGLTVVGWDCCTKEQRLDYLRLTGLMTGQTDRATALIELQEQSDVALRTLWENTPESDFTPILVVDQLNDQIRVIANGSDDYSLSGAKNLAADGTEEWWRTIDAEQFLVWNPHVILIPSYANDLTPGDFYDNPLLGAVEAVKNRRVYKVPQFTMTPDAPEVYLAAPWTARVLHGEDTVPDFRDQMLTAYQTAYGKELTDTQFDEVLLKTVNANSADYTSLFE